MTNPTPSWRFWIPLLFQTTLILTVPAQAIYTQLTGKTVILQTVPADPYDLLRGYSQTLRYDISSQDSLRQLPGWQELPKQQPRGNKLAFIEPGTRFYVILAAPVSPALNELPQPWKPIAVSTRRPAKLPANQIALKGLAQPGSVQYGLETYYIPEDQREQINSDLRAARMADPTQPQQTLPEADPTQPQQTPPVVMEIKVNTKGDAVPISLWAQVGEPSKPQIRSYRF
ncbi:MAG TPA: GDYXXLXY domain-containing protein [Candidatus Sericytochromatia bacterium]|jgi:uncharacterized membrane-anchored protein